MSNVIQFPTAEARKLELGDREFQRAEALAAYDRRAAIELMMRLCDADHAPEVRLCAARWLIDYCDVQVAI